MTNDCPVCRECKPKYHQPEQVPLIKATQPFERINLDFKGPLPSHNGNKYFLNIIDEYSRFPFVFPCPDVSAGTVIKCLTTLFSLFGMPAYVHSDHGAAFMSHELLIFLAEKGVATSRTTSYNPAGNGQVERYNGVVWKALTMALKSKHLPVKYWQEVLPDVLHSIRSLLCTATNETPHERLFGFTRRSASGLAIPTWMAKPGPVYLKRQGRTSKYDPLVEDVDLLQANPHYAYIRYSDGRETTVSTKHLAPKGQVTMPEVIDCPPEVVEPCPQVEPDVIEVKETQSSRGLPKPLPLALRRSTRICRPIERLDL